MTLGILKHGIGYDLVVMEDRSRHQCPHCGRQQEAASDASGGDAAPKPGDLGMCVDCDGVMVFEDDGQPTKAPPELLEHPLAQVAIARGKLVNAAIRRARALRKAQRN